MSNSMQAKRVRGRRQARRDPARSEAAVARPAPQATGAAMLSSSSLAQGLLEIGERSPIHQAFVVRALRGLRRIVAATTEQRLAEAVGARTDAGAIGRLIETSPEFEPEMSDDPLAGARLRGARMKQELLDRCGGALSASDVAELLSISRQAVDKRRQAGTLLAVELGRRGHVYPACQFTEQGVVAGLAEVIASFSIATGWTRLNCLMTPDPRLGGRLPMDVLKSGDIEGVKRATAAYGEHGAA